MCFYHGTLEHGHGFKIKIKINLYPSMGSVVHGHVEPLESCGEQKSAYSIFR